MRDPKSGRFPIRAFGNDKVLVWIVPLLRIPPTRGIHKAELCRSAPRNDQKHGVIASGVCEAIYPWTDCHAVLYLRQPGASTSKTLLRQYFLEALDNELNLIIADCSSIQQEFLLLDPPEHRYSCKSEPASHLFSMNRIQGDRDDPCRH